VRRLAVGLVAAGAVVLAAAVADVAFPAEPLRGLWTAERTRWKVDTGGTATIVQLSMRRTGGKGHWNSSFSVPLEELEGLTDTVLDAATTEARFTWKRDPGGFAMEGRFQAGAGAGHFLFALNPEYQADMRRRGYGDIDEEKAMSLALHDVSRAFIDEMAGLGYRKLSLDELQSLRIHGATAEYVRGLASLGYRQIPVEQVLAFRIHGVSPDYVRTFKSQGYDRLTGEQLVSMRIHGVSPDFVKDLKSLGYSGVPVDDLVALRIHGVTTDFIKRAQGRSGKAVTVDRLVSMRIHGEGEERD
jgi:hypothetical protein